MTNENNPVRVDVHHIRVDPEYVRALEEGVLPCVLDDGTVIMCTGMSGGKNFVEGGFSTGFPEYLWLTIRNPNGEERYGRYYFQLRTNKDSFINGSILKNLMVPNKP